MREGDHWQLAVWLLKCMAAAAAIPNIVTYNAAISACEKGFEWHHAFVLLAALGNANLRPDNPSYSAAMSAREERWWNMMQ